MTNKGSLFPNLLEYLAEKRRNPRQMNCKHWMSSRMKDGNYYCPSCDLVSPDPLMASQREPESEPPKPEAQP